MIEGALPHHAGLSWPPAHLTLAARAHPERADDADTALDRWTAGRWLTLPRPWSRTAERRLLQAVARFEAQDGWALMADARLVAGLRSCAGPAFQGRGAALPQALALLRELARRRLGLHAHPAQLLAAAHLVHGRLVELDTGEGKTLCAALAAALAGLAGVPTHVVTVNDYLAQRDAALMQPLYAALGLSVGVVHGGVAQGERAAQYRCAITYCTNKDLVFDYLRDRVDSAAVQSLAQLESRRRHADASAAALRLRGLHYAIVDEADSVLIDEARTPLILSAPRGPDADEARYAELLAAAAALQLDSDFRLAGPQGVPELLEAGRLRLEAWAEAALAAAAPSDASAGDEVWRIGWVREHYALLALRALHVLRRDHQYVVADGKVVIVDEFTGRLLPDRRWEQGLHQLVEAKEGCAVTGSNRTLARLTYQHLFGRYLRLAGMSGTLREVAAETAGLYRVRTRRVPPHRPCCRRSWPARLLGTVSAKEAAVVNEVREGLARGQPVLIGTRSVQASMQLSQALRAAGLAHRVLNALQTADEAELIAQAGQAGAVTVATNLAGRGTDIPLTPAALSAGGLHVVLTEWHESARIDRQLFGRGARQGDPGSCRAITALDDELVQRHGNGLLRWAARRWSDARRPAWLTALLRWQVQGAAERANAAQRRRTMDMDRRMRQQLAFSGNAE
jgi:preprotein translocase subunit SecA